MKSRTVGDILVAAGFDRPDRLAPVLAAWDDLLHFVRPDLAVGDFTPGLCLALRGSGIPVAIIGSGFALPPAADAFPPYVDGIEASPPPTLFAAVNEVLSRRGQPPLTRLPDIFTAQARFVTTLPDLDHHDARRRPEERGPIKPLPPPAVALPSVDYFAYLAFDWPQVGAVLEGLARSGLEGSIYPRSASPEQVAAARQRGLTVHDSPRDVEAELEAAAVLVHHAGLGTLEVGLARGRPQLLCPRQVEQSLNANVAVRLGVAIRTSFPPSFSADQIAGGLRRLRDEARYAERARAYAESLAARYPVPGVERVAAALEGLLSRRGGSRAREA